MKEVKAALKSVVESLKALSERVDTIANKIEKGFPEEKAAAKPKRKPAAKKKVVAKKPAPKKTAQKKTKKTTAPKKAKKAPAQKKETAAEKVLAVINASNNGADVASLAKDTGFNKRKLANNLYRLKKAGKIKAVGRGVYTKAS